MFSQRKFGCLAAILTVFAAGSAARAAEPVSLQFDFSVPPRHVVAEVTNTTASPRYDFGVLGSNPPNFQNLLKSMI